MENRNSDLPDLFLKRGQYLNLKHPFIKGVLTVTWDFDSHIIQLFRNKIIDENSPDIQHLNSFNKLILNPGEEHWEYRLDFHVDESTGKITIVIPEDLDTGAFELKIVDDQYL